MSNLKVNSLTQILEFKRKHNKLVDEFGKLPQSENISKVLEVEDIGSLTMEEYNQLNDFNIVKSGNIFYYKTMHGGGEYYFFTIFDDSSIEFRKVYLEDETPTCETIFTETFSDYALKSEAGTKLYKHILTLSGTSMILDESQGIDDTGEFGEIVIISTSPNQITMPAPEESDIELITGYDVITIGCCYLSFGTINIFKVGTVKLDINCTNKYLVVDGVEAIADNVTPL